MNRSQEEFNTQLQKNQNSVIEYSNDVLFLNALIPNLNEQMCDGRGNPCDSLCGGAGCEKCGGLSCDNGALSKADKALEFAKDTQINIKKKEETADNLIRALSQAKSNATEISESAIATHRQAESFYNHTMDLVKRGNECIDDLVSAINNNTASPEDITDIAGKVKLFFHI